MRGIQSLSNVESCDTITVDVLLQMYSNPKHKINGEKNYKSINHRSNYCEVHV